MKPELKPWSIHHLDSLVKYANNANVSNNLMDQFPYPYSREHGMKFIESRINVEPANSLAITVDDHAIGGIGIHPQADILRLNAELGYWVAEPFWGRGLGTEAVRQMVDYAFRTFEITRIFGRVFGTNHASARALEKAGFTLEARFSKTLIKNGEILDELIYAVRKDSSIGFTNR